MADSSNPGQFGERDDTKKQAQKGGQNSSGQFGAENGADPKKAGAAGAEAQPREAKVEGGKKGGSNSSRDED
jgi:hypothetical protein